MGKILFITGTDTGVGKTVLTAMLLRHLRESGVNALAMKPFCSGSRGDARLLRGLQENLLTLEEINPFFFCRPVAPLADPGRHNRIRLDSVLGKIRALARRCDVLLVEGIGGLMVPLEKNFTVADVVSGLQCPVLVVSANRLGTINHTLLTVKVMQEFGIKEFAIVMMGAKKSDVSAYSNVTIVQKMLPGRDVFQLPNLGVGASFPREIKINVKKMKKVLARILEGAIFTPVRPKKRLS